MMATLRVLILEDRPADAELVAHELDHAGFAPAWTRVDTEAAFREALADPIDLILADYHVPGFGATRALEVLAALGLNIPVIIVSGTIGEDLAVAALHAGAADYLMKDRLARLGPAVTHALEARRLRKEQQAAEDAARRADRRALEAAQTLSRQLVDVQEAERRHIALELHDEVGQILTGLKLLLDMEIRRDHADPARLREATGLVSQLVEKVRHLSLDLRPPMLDDLGLHQALLWHFSRYTDQTGIAVSFSAEGLDAGRLPPRIATAAYRIIQEALTNAARHAQISAVEVAASRDNGALTITVADGGRGFDPGTVESTSGGLIGMRERAKLLHGTFVLSSAPGRGTRLTVTLPLGGAGG